MVDDASASKSDLEALRSAGRGKVIALGAVLCAALAGAGWYFFGQKKGVGSAENPAKVLVVRSDNMVGWSGVLDDGGFDAAEGTLDHWAERAKTEIPELEVGGIEAVMTLADTFGYGYVVFDSPADVDFSALEIEGKPDAFPEHVEFAVLSVGDFAFPHKMTVNPEPSKALQSFEISLLQALFAQEQLAAARPDNHEDAGLAQVQLRDQLANAIDELEKLPQAEQLAEKVAGNTLRLLVDGERATPRPKLLGPPLQSAVPIPLPSGDVLSIARDYGVVTSNGVTAELSPEEEERFLFGPADGDPMARKTCDALAGGTISLRDQGAPKYWASSDGAALVIERTAGNPRLYVWKEGGTGCAFEDRGEIVGSTFDSTTPPIPHRSGRVARTLGRADGIAISVWEQGKDARTLGPVDESDLSAPIWLSSSTLASIGDEDIVLFDLEHPDAPLRIGPSVFAAGEGEADGGLAHAPSVSVLAPIPGRDDAFLAVLTDGRLFLVQFDRSWPKLFAEPRLAVASDEAPTEVDAEEPPAGELPTDDAAEHVPPTRHLDPKIVKATALTRRGHVDEPRASADGKHVVFTIFDSALDQVDASDDSEIAIVPISGGELKLVTKNALQDGRAAFTADGRHVLMTTRIDVPKTRWKLTTARATEL